MCYCESMRANLSSTSNWQHCMCPGVCSHMSEDCLDEEETWLLVLLATP